MAESALASSVLRVGMVVKVVLGFSLDPEDFCFPTGLSSDLTLTLVYIFFCWWKRNILGGFVREFE